MNTTLLSKLLFGWVLSAFVLGAIEDVSASEMMNVLFIAADDLRCDLTCYGHAEVKTPNLDRLAKQGVLFERAYCQQALCNPSRASLLTGRRPDSLGIWNLPKHFREVDPKIVTLPEHFKNQGYYTQSIGKIFHNWRQDIQGDPQSWSVGQQLHFARHDDDQPQVEGELPVDEATAPRCHRLDVPDDAYFDGRIATAAIKTMAERAAKKQPFFLAVGFWKPHLPFNAPKKYWDLYDRASIKLPVNSERPTSAPEIAFHDSREILRAAKGKLKEPEVRELRHGYLAGISYLDAQVGRLLNQVERLDLMHKTVIVFWSDHGFHLGEHDLWCKTSNFELDARVPLIITAPDIAVAGSRTTALAELLDLYPTLTDLCGLPKPNGAEGVSLRPVLEDPTREVKNAAFTQHPRPNYYKQEPQSMGVSVRTSRFRYTQWRDFRTKRLQAEELYDHRRDPFETINRATDAAYASGLKRAQKLLEAEFGIAK